MCRPRAIERRRENFFALLCAFLACYLFSLSFLELAEIMARGVVWPRDRDRRERKMVLLILLLLVKIACKNG